MKRRSFLQALGAALAAVFAPKVAKANADYLTDPAKWFIKPSGFKPYHGSGGIVRTGVAEKAVFSGDICVLDDGKYRPLTHGDFANIELNTAQLAVASQDGHGGRIFVQDVVAGTWPTP